MGVILEDEVRSLDGKSTFIGELIIDLEALGLVGHG